MRPRVTFLNAAGVLTAAHTMSADASRLLESSMVFTTQECELSTLLSTRIVEEVSRKHECVSLAIGT